VGKTVRVRFLSGLPLGVGNSKNPKLKTYMSDKLDRAIVTIVVLALTVVAVYFRYTAGGGH